MMKRLLVKGFTLIELMIVVAIVAILAAIAVPAYQGYMARAQLVEIIEFASAAEHSIASYWAEGGTTPSNSSIDLSGTGKYVSGMTIQSGNDQEAVLVLSINRATTIAAAGAETDPTVTLTGTKDNDGTVDWDCKSTLDQAYLPEECTSTNS